MIAENDCQRLEQEIDRLTEQTGPLRNFILPGGGEAAAYCHVARAVCRRAERALIALDAEHSVRDELKVYINRLSDLLFALARFLNHQANIPEVIWLGKDSSGNGQ
jgi:cob(I)alamin adenosyltransferase